MFSCCKAVHGHLFSLVKIFYFFRSCPTRQTGCGVHPFQQLSNAQLPTVVGVAGQHNLTHFHFSGVSVVLLVLFNKQRVQQRVAIFSRWCHVLTATQTQSAERRIRFEYFASQDRPDGNSKHFTSVYIHKNLQGLKSWQEDRRVLDQTNKANLGNRSCDSIL